MKKLLSLLLIITAIASMLTAFSVETAAADNGTLKITCEGAVLAEVEVGNEFLYQVGLNTAGYSPWIGDGVLDYDSDYVEVVAYGPADSSGAVYPDGYSFPESVRNSNLVSNYTYPDQILYNFSKYNSGVGVYSDTSVPFFKVRFRALTPGTVEIRHTFKLLALRINNQYLQLIENGKGNDQLDPIPYSVSSVETAAGLVGDADGDFELTVLDATFIQYLTAGRDSVYKTTNADVNSDGEVNLRDALAILRYKAGLSAYGNIGEWIFASEQ